MPGKEKSDAGKIHAGMDSWLQDNTGNTASNSTDFNRGPPLQTQPRRLCFFWSRRFGREDLKGTRPRAPTGEPGQIGRTRRSAPANTTEDGCATAGFRVKPGKITGGFETRPSKGHGVLSP